MMCIRSRTIGRTGRTFVLVLLGFFLATGTTPPESERQQTERHDFHVSYSRIAIENQIILARTRFFRDDLTESMAKFTQLESFSLDASPRTDSLFTVYFNNRFVVEVAGKHLPGRIVGSGEEVEGKERIWWYAMQYDAPNDPNSIRISNTLLLNVFDDQKNILKIQKFPSERSSTFYFDADNTTIEVTF